MMPTSNGAPRGPRLSVSTWSLHRALGRPAFYGPDTDHIPLETHGRGTLTLLEVPARIRAFGISTLEICHFHLPRRDPGYLTEVRGALEASGIELWSLLIDAGDVTDALHGARDAAWIREWLAVAATLGARRARVIAGKAMPSQEALARSRDALATLAIEAVARNLRLMTENWFPLLSRPDTVLNLLDSLDGQVGLCLDFGNWNGATKYDDLAAIAPRAESCHAKAHFDATGAMAVDDYVRCFDLTRAATFSGPYTLIYDGPDDDEWAGLERERAIARPYLDAPGTASRQ